MDNEIILRQVTTSFELSLFSGFTMLTMIICYIIAVTLDHVPAWLPMISDCAVGYPEAYIFRTGLTIAAFFHNFNGYQAYLYLKKKNEYYVIGGFTSKLALLICTIASICLAIVAVVNEVEDDHLHSIAAATYFILDGVHMWILIILMRVKGILMNPSNISILIKIILAFFYTVDLIAVGIMVPHWSDDRTYIAMGEWLAATILILFNFSFCYDLGNSMYLATLWKKKDCLLHLYEEDTEDKIFLEKSTSPNIFQNGLKHRKSFSADSINWIV